MKLYLRAQIEARALEVWGSEEALDRAHAEKDEKRERSKAKKFGKQMRALRMQGRRKGEDRGWKGCKGKL